MLRIRAVCRFGAAVLPSFLVLSLTGGCRYAAARPGGDVVDYIIAGDAQNAARRCDYPLRVNAAYPVFPAIRDERDFVRWFPVVFDRKERRRLQRDKSSDKDSGGWDFRNWQGEAFAGGRLWRDGDTKKLFALNVVSESLYEHWRTAYQRDLQTLSPRYRDGCRRAACYFISEDHAYFGRVDIMGDLWTAECPYGSSHCERARIMLFKRGQKPSDVPWRVFNYDAKDDKEHPNGGNADELSSEKEDFTFIDYTNAVVPPDSPAMSLSFGTKAGKGTCLRLESSETWPPQK